MTLPNVHQANDDIAYSVVEHTLLAIGLGMSIDEQTVDVLLRGGIPVAA